MNYIGIDLGTSALKLLLMDQNGALLKTVSREYPISFPESGYSEQNPDDWWKAVKNGIPELLKGYSNSSVKGIGTAGQMHGLVVLDQDDNIIRPAILWNDSRSEEETEYLNYDIGKKKLLQYTANIAYPGFTAPKLLWMKKHEPGLFSRIAKIMLPKDYINYKLTGVFSTDYSDASGTLLLDVVHKKWSAEMMKICSVQREQLPKLFESDAIVGHLKSSVSDELQLPDEVLVCAGAGDNAAAAVSSGAVVNGRCNLSIGTSGTIFIAADHLADGIGNSLHAFVHANHQFHLMGCILSAASCNQWWNNNILNQTDYAEEQRFISSDKLGNNDVYFLPYLMGERSPLNDASAKGCFIGMHMDTKREDMTQAVLEGVAFAIRDCLEVVRKQGIAVNASTICGGGMKSPLWRKIFANVLNIPLEIPEIQGSGYGAAILAAVGCGEWKNTEEAAEKIIRIKETDQPDELLAAEYEKKYQTWHQIYPALKELYKNMGDHI